MSAKLKLVLATVICTAVAWAVVLAGVSYLCNRHADRPLPVGNFYFFPPGKEPVLATTWNHTGDPSSVVWEPKGGEFLIRLLSSNANDSASALLYTHTSRPPARIQFQTVLVESKTNK